MKRLSLLLLTSWGSRGSIKVVAIRSRVKASSRLTIIPDIVLALSLGSISGDFLIYILEVKFSTEPSAALKQSFHILNISFRLLSHGWRALIVLAGRLESIQEPLFGNDASWALQNINERILLLRVSLIRDE